MESLKADSFLIERKYHPKSVDEIIAPKRIKDFIEGIIKEGNVLGYVFSGGAGCGKTTTAEMIGSVLELETKVISGSINNGIDDIRALEDLTKTATMNGNYRLIIIDEADYLSKNAQAGLRNLINISMGSTRFILTCNYPEKIIPSLRDSRLPLIDFTYSEEEMNEVSGQMWGRIGSIVQEEGWEVEDKKSLADFMVSHLPNIRFIFKTLQIVTSMNGGKIPSKIELDETTLTISSFKEMVMSDYQDMRKFVALTPQTEIFGFVYKNLTELIPSTDEQVKVMNWLAYYQGLYKGVEDIYTTTFLLNLRGIISQ